MSTLVRTLTLGTAAEMATLLNNKLAGALAHYSLAAVIPIDEPTHKSLAIFQQTGNATSASVKITEIATADSLQMEATINGLLAAPAYQDFKVATTFLLEGAGKYFVVFQRLA